MSRRHYRRNEDEDGDVKVVCNKFNGNSKFSIHSGHHKAKSLAILGWFIIHYLLTALCIRFVDRHSRAHLVHKEALANMRHLFVLNKQVTYFLIFMCQGMAAIALAQKSTGMTSASAQ